MLPTRDYYVRISDDRQDTLRQVEGLRQRAKRNGDDIAPALWQAVLDKQPIPADSPVQRDWGSRDMAEARPNFQRILKRVEGQKAKDPNRLAELVVFDFGASLDHLTMDITRTFNISGKFTPEQAKWYAVDLESQQATIALLRPGHTYEEAEAAGKAVFDKAGIGEQWYGFPGHFVGLATHDVLHPSGPIKSGQVVTVEPIVEFLDKRMHFRVEDTILITNGEPENLSSAIPKELADVEKLVGSAKDNK